MLATANLLEIYYFNLGHRPRVDVMNVGWIKLIVRKSLGMKVTETFQDLRNNTCSLAFMCSCLLPQVLKDIISL